jgi:hypothetical protein
LVGAAELDGRRSQGHRRRRGPAPAQAANKGEITGKEQLDVAAALRIKQPSVSKIEKQTDMYLSTLRSYIEAIGGKLELVVKLPKRPAIRLHQLGDAVGASLALEPAMRCGEGVRPDDHPIRPEFELQITGSNIMEGKTYARSRATRLSILLTGRYAAGAASRIAPGVARSLPQ